MGIAEAKKYIRLLHKKQEDPYLWPDYLTGLPDKTSVIKKIYETSPKLGEYSIAYIKITNIQPYLLHYGPDKHAEIIQWAAAIIKTTADKCHDSFAGTFNTHDFIMICKTKNVAKLFEEAREIFRKTVLDYYSRKDLAKGEILFYDRNDGKKVNKGLMKLIAVVADKKLRVKRNDLLMNMARICDALEGSKDDIVVMNNDMILRNYL